MFNKKDNDDFIMIISEINDTRIIYKINKNCDITKLTPDTLFFEYDFDKYTSFY